MNIQPSTESLEKKLAYLGNDKSQLKTTRIWYNYTNKLYHKKWIYRVKCKNLLFTKAWDYNTEIYDKFYNWLGKFYLLSNTQVRNEGRFKFLYFNDDSFLEEIHDDNVWIVECSIPENIKSADLLLNSTRSIKLCNHYYRGEYRYKIYLKSKTDFEIRQKFKEWVMKYDDSTFFIPGFSMKWLDSKGKWVTDSPYLYVKDYKTISMISLMLGNNIKSFEEYILKNSINNTNSEILEDVSL